MNKQDKNWLKSKQNTLNDLISNLEFLNNSNIHSEIYWLKNFSKEITERTEV